MNAITYRITLDEPALVTRLGGEPNGAVALDYLPGSVLRGAIIGAYLRHRGLTDLEADPDGFRLFLEDGTRFLNGYPLHQDRRSLPVPLSLYRPKEAEDRLYDFAVEE